MILPNVAYAHPERGRGYSFTEQFAGEGVAWEKQHPGDDGHLPAKAENVTLVGKGSVTNPSGDGNTGRVADVFAFGDYAYLNAFREPTCKDGGVHVRDISDLSAPDEVETRSSRPASASTRARASRCCRSPARTC